MAIVNKRRCLNCKKWYQPLANVRIYCSQKCAKAHIGLRQTISDAERINQFRAKCAKRESGCIEWIGRTGAKGYGYLKFHGKNMSAHRFAYWLAHGSLPPAGKCVCHRCDNPICVNQAHFFVGTVAENNADMARKGRAARGSKHHWSKLNEKQVAEIRRSNKMGKDLAYDYDINASVISQIRSRQIWRHVR